jgi:F-type H+-transporting ATPase subunit a
MRARLLGAAAPLALLLAAPAAATAAEQFSPQEEFLVTPWIELRLGPLDMSINKFVFYLFLAAVLTIGIMLFIGRRMQAKPNRVQTAIEAAYDLTNRTITRDNIDDRRVASRWFAFLATLFFFIWVSNLIGFIPLPVNTNHKVDVLGFQLPTFAIYAATANFSMPLVLTLVVWFSYQFEGVRKKGIIGWPKSWIPSGVPKAAVPLVFGIEMVSQVLRLASLSARLFANMLAGHLLIIIMAGGMAVILGSGIVGLLLLPVGTAFWIFEVGLVASLQAFIFAILSAIYLGEATTEEAH